MQKEHEQKPEEMSLKPYGRIIEGEPGISATRLGEALGITIGQVRKLFKVIGVMKIPYCNAFKVYDPGLAITMKDDPTVVKARERKQKRQLVAKEAAEKAARTRKNKCADALCGNRPDLRFLYQSIVDTMWSPSQEFRLLYGNFYSKTPALLWDALQPAEGSEDEAVDIITDIMWACQKRRTWKVNRDWKEQEEPLVFTIYSYDLSTETAEDLEIYKNVFLAAIRHAYYNDLDMPKADKRELAFKCLKRISNRDWGSSEEQDPSAYQCAWDEE